jgi:hypothetical protein
MLAIIIRVTTDLGLECTPPSSRRGKGVLCRAQVAVLRGGCGRLAGTDTIPLSQLTGSFAIPPSRPAGRPARKAIRATPIVPIPGRPRFPDQCDRKPPLEEEPLFSSEMRYLGQQEIIDDFFVRPVRSSRSYYRCSAKLSCKLSHAHAHSSRNCAG